MNLHGYYKWACALDTSTTIYPFIRTCWVCTKRAKPMLLSSHQLYKMFSFDWICQLKIFVRSAMTVPATCLEGTRVYRHGFCNSSLKLLYKKPCVGFGISGLRICHLCCQRCPVTHKWPCYILQRFCEANRCTWVGYKGCMLFQFRCETTSTESNALDNWCPCSECSCTTLEISMHNIW